MVRTVALSACTLVLLLGATYRSHAQSSAVATATVSGGVVTLASQIEQSSAANDEALAEDVRKEFLLEVSPEDGYIRYMAEPDIEKRKAIFMNAWIEVTLAPYGGIPRETSVGSISNDSFGKLLLRQLSRLIPAPAGSDMLARVLVERFKKSSDSLLSKIADEDVDRQVTEGMALVKALIALYLSEEKAETFDADAPLVKADRIMEVCAAVLASMEWPNVFLLSQIDTPGGGYSARYTILSMLGESSPEYVNFEKLSYRQKGEAVKNAYLSATEVSRLAAQGKMSFEEFESRASAQTADPERAVFETFGSQVLAEYKQTKDPALRRDFEKAAILVRAAWRMLPWFLM